MCGWWEEKTNGLGLGQQYQPRFIPGEIDGEPSDLDGRSRSAEAFSGQNWPRQDSSFPAQAQVAAWARGAGREPRFGPLKGRAAWARGAAARASWAGWAAPGGWPQAAQCRAGFQSRAEIEILILFYSELFYLFSRSIFLMNFVQI